MALRHKPLLAELPELEDHSLKPKRKIHQVLSCEGDSSCVPIQYHIVVLV